MLVTMDRSFQTFGRRRPQGFNLRRVAARVGIQCLAFGAGPALGGTPIDVYILCGQSNMVGSGNVAELNQDHPELAFQDDVLYWYQLTTAPPADPDIVAGSWGPLRELSAEGHSFGLELSFGRAIADASETPVAILKTAANGASIDFYTREGAASQYWLHLSHDARIAVLGLTAQGYEPTVRAFVWVQGSSDSNHPEYHLLYDENLEDLAAGVRLLWGNDLLVVQSQQHCCGPFPQDWIDDVRNAKAMFRANDANATLAVTDDLTLRPDQIHFEWQSLLTLGERLAADLLNHVPEDINGDGAVDTADLGLLISDFGVAGKSRADLNGDAVVDTADLGFLIGAFGTP